MSDFDREEIDLAIARSLAEEDVSLAEEDACLAEEDASLAEEDEKENKEEDEKGKKVIGKFSRTSHLP